MIVVDVLPVVPDTRRPRRHVIMSNVSREEVDG